MTNLTNLLSLSPWSMAQASANIAQVEPPSLKEMAQIASTIRRNILIMTTAANSGHPGGSLSAVETLVCLYYNVMRHDPKNPRWSERDRFVLSKAHASPVIYATLADRGYFPFEELITFRRIDSRLQGHAHVMVPGVEFSGGSLGQGFSFAIGLALASKIDGSDSHIYAMIGDGECDEGQIWEAAMSASHHNIDNLTVVVDRNRIQNDRFTSEAMEIEPLGEKWRAFGWNVQECDGHDFSQLLDALSAKHKISGQPSCIIAHTTKGKGVSFMENNPGFHGKAATPEELGQAIEEIDSSVLP